MQYIYMVFLSCTEVARKLQWTTIPLDVKTVWMIIESPSLRLVD